MPYPGAGNPRYATGCIAFSTKTRIKSLTEHTLKRYLVTFYFLTERTVYLNRTLPQVLLLIAVDHNHHYVNLSSSILIK